MRPVQEATTSAPLPHNPRLPVIALALTLLGLLALLIIPMISHQHADRIHTEIEEQIEPALDRINEAISSAYAIHVMVYEVYFYAHPAEGTPQARTWEEYNQLVSDWYALTAEDRTIAPGGLAALEQWREGKMILTDWFETYGRNGQAYDQDKIPVSDARFRQGIAALYKARTQTEQRQRELRRDIEAISQRQLNIMVPLSLICLLLAALFWRNLLSLRHSWLREQEVAARLTVAIQETNHRIKNNLQVVSSLMDMQILEADEAVPKEALRGIVQQVKAIAAVHDFLSHEMRGGTVQGERMLEKLVELVAQPAGLQVRLEAEAVGLEVKQATAVALITNELLLNSGKHGATEACVTIRSEGNVATLQVADNGPGFPANFNSATDSNLGIALVETLARHDLAGSIAFQTHNGALVEITFPLQSLPEIEPRAMQAQK